MNSLLINGLVVLILTSNSLTSLISSPKIRTSNVLDDLTSANIDLNDNYDELSVISFQEYSYSLDGSNSFGLYVYLVNPDLISFDLESNLNKIEINYSKYHLNLISSELSSKFIKFSVDGFTNELATACGRVYKVSGFELYSTGSNAIEYKVGGEYKFSGFVSSDNLTCDVKDLETLDLNVRDTYYRFNSVDSAVKTQLDSVYFGVPNKILLKYGTLDSIKAEYYEYKTSPIFVMKSSDYSLFNYWVGVNQTSSNHCDYGILTSSSSNLTSETSGGAYYSYDPLVKMPLTYTVSSSYWTKNLTYLFDGGGTGLVDVSRDRLKSYIYNYDKSYINGRNYKGLSEDLFQGKVDDGHVRGFNQVKINSKDKMSLFTFDGNTGWDYFLNQFRKREDVTTINPIVKVDNIVGKTASDLYINDNDYGDFKSSFNSNLASNKSTFIFRFSSSKYFADQVCDYHYGDLAYEGVDGFVASESVYLDFDILSLTFSKEGVFHEMAVVMSPIDVIADITAPLTSNWLLDLIKSLFLILLGVLIIYFVARLLIALAPTFKTYSTSHKTVKKYSKKHKKK